MLYTIIRGWRQNISLSIWQNSTLGCTFLFIDIRLNNNMPSRHNQASSWSSLRTVIWVCYRIVRSNTRIFHQSNSISSFNSFSVGFRPFFVLGSSSKNSSWFSLFLLQLLQSFFSTFYPALRNCFLLQVGATHDKILRLKFKRCSFDLP